MGYPGQGVMEVNNEYVWVFDGFGTNVLFAMYSSARGVPAYLAAPGFAALLLSWTAAGVYPLVRRASGLPRPLAFLAGIGVSGGWLFRMLASYGAFGQLAGCCGAVLLFGAAFGGAARAGSVRSAFLRVCVPILFIFLCYQASFFLFCALASLSLFLYRAFGGGAAPPEAGAAASPPAAGVPGRAARLAIASALPVLASVLACAALSPVGALEAVDRLFSAASQTAGFGLGLLPPLLFAGFPTLAEGPFGLREDVRAVEWALFLAAFTFLWRLSLRRTAARFPGRDAACMSATASVFGLCLCAYLALFAWKGDVYQFWKLVTMTALPLSFVPAALLLTGLYVAVRGRAGRFAVALAASALLCAAPRGLYTSPGGPLAEAGYPSPLRPLSIAVDMAFDANPGPQEIVFDLSTAVKTAASALAAQYRAEGKLHFTGGGYFITPANDYMTPVARGAVLFSDRLYPGLYGGTEGTRAESSGLYRYLPEDLARSGAVEFHGFKRFGRSPNQPVVSVGVLVPEAMLDSDLNLKVAVRREGGDGEAACGGETAREALSPPEEAVPLADGAFRLRIPAPGRKGGFIGLVLRFPSLPASAGTPDGNGGAGASAGCGYVVGDVEITPVSGPPGDIPAAGGPEADGPREGAAGAGADPGPPGS
jgi:hypothetical protein